MNWNYMTTMISGIYDRHFKKNFKTTDKKFWYNYQFHVHNVYENKWKQNNIFIIKFYLKWSNVLDIEKEGCIQNANLRISKNQSKILICMRYFLKKTNLWISGW